MKLISQLFGDRQMIANATGCSSIYSASIPSTPYTKNEKGQGPVFNRSALPLRLSKNSLFEDFCEFFALQSVSFVAERGLGMALGNKKMKERVAKLLQEAAVSEGSPEEFKALADEWIANKDDADKTKEIAPKLRACIAAGAEKGCPICTELKTLDHYLVKRSQWIIGGDGASYDIGYGGLDHVIASGEDVNILGLGSRLFCLYTNDCYAMTAFSVSIQSLKCGHLLRITSIPVYSIRLIP